MSLESRTFTIEHKSLLSSLVNVPWSIIDSLPCPLQNCALIFNEKPSNVNKTTNITSSPIRKIAGFSGLPSHSDNVIEIDSVLAQTLDLASGQAVGVSIRYNCDSASQVNVSLRDSLSWDMISANIETLESHFMSQIRCVAPQCYCVVYVGTNPVVLKVDSVSTAKDPLSSNTEELFSPACIIGHCDIVVKDPSNETKPDSKDVSPLFSLKTVNSFCQPHLVPSNLDFNTFHISFYIHNSYYNELGSPKSAVYLGLKINCGSLQSTQIRMRGYNKIVSRALFSPMVPLGCIILSPELSKLMGVRTGIVLDIFLPSEKGKQPTSLIASVAAKDSEKQKAIDELDTTLREMMPCTLNQGSIFFTQSFAIKLRWLSKYTWCTLKSMPKIDVSVSQSLDETVKLTTRKCKSTDQIYGIKNFVSECSKHIEARIPICITGPKKSGKSLVLDILQDEMEDLGFRVHRLSCQIFAESGGSGRLTDVLQSLDHTKAESKNLYTPVCLLLDNLDVIAPNGTGNASTILNDSDEISSEFICRKLLEIDDSQYFSIVATAKSRSSLNKVFESRRLFKKYSEIPSLPALEREEIFRANLKLTQANESLNMIISDLVSSTRGFTYFDLLLLCQKLGCSPNSSKWTSIISNYKPASLGGVSKIQAADSAQWSKIGGLAVPKQVLIETIEWPLIHETLFRECPIRLPTGILLYGYPGCGKTMLVQAIAAKTNINFISIKGPEILDKYIGSSEQNIRSIFEKAQAAKPSILFFDEFDSLAPKRGHDSTGVTDRIVNQMLTQLDGAEGLDGVFVIAATSRPDLIDAALLRPGRLDKLVFCDMPNFEERLSILQKVSSDFDCDQNIDLEELARQTKNYSGADLKGLFHRAQTEAVFEMTNQSDYTVINNVVECVSEPILYSFKMDQLKESGEDAVTQGLSDAFDKFLNTSNSVSETTSSSELCSKSEGNSSATKSPASSVSDVIKPNRRSVSISQVHLDAAVKTSHPTLGSDELQKYRRIFQSMYSGERKAGMRDGSPIEEYGKRETLM